MTTAAVDVRRRKTWDPPISSVPRLCPGGTVLCIASGPSLTQDDVEYCRGRVDAAVAVNTSYKMAPWADILYGADSLWWNWHRGAPDFAGLKFSLSRHATKWPRVQLLKNTGDMGIDTDPSALRTGRNSGYQAVNVAVHLGASRIVLLGYDMQKDARGKAHWHKDHPQRINSPYTLFINHFKKASEALKDLGVTVVNCSRDTALECFTRAELRDTL